MINANFRLGGVDEAYQVAEFASDKSQSTPLRLDALDALANWIAPPLLDRVDGRRRYLSERSPAEIAPLVKGNLERLLNSDDSEILEGAIMAANRLSVILSPVALEKLLRNNQASGNLRVEALEESAGSEKYHLCAKLG